LERKSERQRKKESERKRGGRKKVREHERGEE
jgi:hypothetical protein